MRNNSYGCGKILMIFKCPSFSNYSSTSFHPIRWFEYAFSSSVMIFLIAVFFGVTNFWLLFAMFVSNALMNMFGWMMEKINQKREKGEKTDWSAYILGVVAGLVPWIVIVAYFLSVSVAGNAGNIPGFVYVILIVEFILFNTFAINMYLQYKKVGKWKDYLYGERMYQILSLVAKTLLAWIVFGGVFQPS